MAAPKKQEKKPIYKKQALGTLLTSLEKKFPGRVQKGKDISTRPVEGRSSGSILIDGALGNGGYAIGRVIEVFGPESGGKTTTVYTALASALESTTEGEVVGVIDAEHAIDMGHLQRAVGLDIERVVLVQPETAEQAAEIAIQFASSGAFAAIMLDSVAAMCPSSGDYKAFTDGQARIGERARLMSDFLPQIIRYLSINRCTLFCINQIRMKIGSYGNPETTPGGNALKYYASQRVKVSNTGPITKSGEVVGFGVRLKVIKNKTSVAGGTAETIFLFDSGFDQAIESYDFLASKGAIQKVGAYTTVPDDQDWCPEKYRESSDLCVKGKWPTSSRDKAIEFVRENPDLLEAMKAQVLALSLLADGPEDLEPVELDTPADIEAFVDEVLDEGKKKTSKKKTKAKAKKKAS